MLVHKVPAKIEFSLIQVHLEVLYIRTLICCKSLDKQEHFKPISVPCFLSPFVLLCFFVEAGIC